MKEISKISIVSPVFKAEKIIEELVFRIQQVMSGLEFEYEVILIEDASPDDSWSKIVEVAENNSNIKGYKLSRNFGQHAAIKAGLSVCDGDVAIVMDCDLQDNPKYIVNLIEQYQKGYDVVYTYKKERQHSFFKNITASLFNKIFNYLADSKEVSSSNSVGTFSLLSRKVINEFVDYNDYQFHYLMVLRWLGFNSTSIEIIHEKRFEGESSYNFKKLLKHAAVGIIYQSDKLLRINIYIGAFIAITSFTFGLFVFVKSFFSTFLDGWASLAIFMSFSLGMILMSIGVVGLYIGKMFEQTKSRKQFIITQKTNSK